MNYTSTSHAFVTLHVSRTQSCPSFFSPYTNHKRVYFLVEAQLVGVLHGVLLYIVIGWRVSLRRMIVKSILCAGAPQNVFFVCVFTEQLSSRWVKHGVLKDARARRARLKVCAITDHVSVEKKDSFVTRTSCDSPKEGD